MHVHYSQHPVRRPAIETGQQIQLQPGIFRRHIHALLHLPDEVLDAFTQLHTSHAVGQRGRWRQIVHVQPAQYILTGMGCRQNMLGRCLRETLGRRPQTTEQLHGRHAPGVLDFKPPATAPVVPDLRGIGLRFNGVLDMPPLRPTFNPYLKHLVLQLDKLLVAYAVEPLPIGLKAVKGHSRVFVEPEVRPPQTFLAFD